MPGRAMSEPTTAELRAWLETEIACASDPFDHRSEKDAVRLRALLDMLAGPVLPEGWEIVRDGRGGVGLRDRHMTLIASLHHAASASGPLSWISWTSQAPTPAARGFLLAAANATARTIEEEGA